MGEWGEFAKKLKTEAEQTTEESKNPGEGVGIGYLDTDREIGTASPGESAVKFDVTVFEVISSAWKECEEQLCYDAISGDRTVKELVEAARKVVVETFRRQGVCEKVPVEECWKYAVPTMAKRRILSAGADWWPRR